MYSTRGRSLTCIPPLSPLPLLPSLPPLLSFCFCLLCFLNQNKIWLYQIWLPAQSRATQTGDCGGPVQCHSPTSQFHQSARIWYHSPSPPPPPPLSPSLPSSLLSPPFPSPLLILCRNDCARETWFGDSCGAASHAQDRLRPPIG